jgi:tRNA (guanine37-N1)-methyltransferase
VLTLFPEIFAGYLGESLLRRAIAAGLVEVQLHDIRGWSTDKHNKVDDRPFGGGPGMVLMAEPLAQCVEAARVAQAAAGYDRTRVLVLSASGVPLNDARVRALAAAAQPVQGAQNHAAPQGQGLVLVCGRYEGIDQRFVDAFADEEVSIGDFILSGGEIAAMALIDAVVRHVPGTMKAQSVEEESFAGGLLDVPHYTRPESWRGQAVPAVLLSGHHAQIARWREEQARARTQKVRPDLLPEVAGKSGKID